MLLLVLLLSKVRVLFHLNSEKSTFNEHNNDIVRIASVTNASNDKFKFNKTSRIITYGKPRTASTLQFHLVCVCLSVHVQIYVPSLTNTTSCLVGLGSSIAGKPKGTLKSSSLS